MEQLSGLDAAFVHQDSRRTPMHFSAVLVYDSGDGDQWAISRNDLKLLVSRRLSRFPLFRHRLHRVAMGMDAPYWVDSGEPDWDRHIGEQWLSPAGDWQALQRLIGSLHTARMNLAIPLWEMHLLHGLTCIPGLPVNCQALVVKIHHSAIDGISLAAMIDSLHQPGELTGRQRSKKALPPTLWNLWARANLNSMNRRLKLAGTVQKLLPGVMRARAARQQFSDLPPVLRTGAHFNARVGAGRSTGAVLLPMADVLAIKRAVRRVTLNDIAMACVAGALREYLAYHRRLPKRSLASGVPINLRDPADQYVGGNRIGTMIVGLATDIGDPVERLRRIHRYAVAGKKHITALGSGTIMDISDSLAPAVLAESIRAIARASLISEMPVPFHTMISNVPGPPYPLRLGEARLVVPMGFGPIRDNMGLFHIVSSSESMLSLSFCACDRLVPDGTFYQQCLQTAFAALLDASRQQ
jgi:diacylglycerol O-acyltransferase